MTEAIKQAEQQHAAWIMQGQTVCAGHAIRIDVDSDGQGAPASGDWVVVLGADYAVCAAGRILRLRSDNGGRTAYFDRCLGVDPAIPLVELGMTVPSVSVTRLPWDDFLKLLSELGAESPDKVPLIEDAAYVRDLLELSVRDDLLGPAGGPQELIKDMSVRSRYLVGKLAPLRSGADQANQMEPAAANGEDGDLEDEVVASRHEPGAEFAGAAGLVVQEDDALDEIDTTSNQSLVPSSMGLTFCVAPNTEALVVSVRWGRYERVPNDEHDVTKTRKNQTTGRDEVIKVKVRRRIPCGGRKKLSLAEGPIKPFAPDREQPKVQVQGTVGAVEKEGRLVTLFLVNGQEESDRSMDDVWLFQPEISVEPPEGHGDDPVFRNRPSGNARGGDSERKHLALIYRNRLEFAVGHGTSVHADTAPDDPARALRIRTEIIPRHEVAITETAGIDPKDRPAMRRMVEEGWLDMEQLSEMAPELLREALSCLVDDYAIWITEQRAELEEIADHRDPGEEVVKRGEEVLRRLREGIGALFEDPTALEAFRFANRSMAMQRIRSVYALKRRRGEEADLHALEAPKFRSWHPFQLAFLLLSVPSLADPTHPDRTDPVEAIADLLWFPTGGGKTEAYLGVAAFAMAMRRLKCDLGGLDASRGLAVIMRYTLRLLTLQQFQRAATLICAMEVIRREDEGKWGREPFTLGLWVGNSVTPGTTEKSHQAVEAIRNGNSHRAGTSSPAQLTRCPWCGSEISGGRDIVVDRIAGRTLIHCGDKLGECDFAKAKSGSEPHPGLPVKVVDEEIYHRPPAMLIATVDKFAMMAWRPEVRNLFGRVKQECERHGLLGPKHDCRSGHRKKGLYPAASVKPVRAIRPPDLIIQDEFHLISGPLGTLVGLYETAVDELSSWTLGDAKVRPKVVASTATVRRAEDQMRNVFMRCLSVFPPSGLDVEDNFFSVQRSVVEKPGRRYLGICAPGSSRPAVLIRTYTAFLTAAQALYDQFGPVADPYMTLVGYFNSLRELGGMRRLVEDDVQTRSFRVGMSLVDRPGLSQRRVEEICELTSRISSQQIPRHLDQLEVRFDETVDPAHGKVAIGGRPVQARPLDAVLATNMLSVGVDVNRLGAMVVNGQPKGAAEYIQATSRVGRMWPGLVATVFTWARPRDLSHYETFEHYHETFYQHVEAQSVTPFSPRALDRGLTGAMLSIMRHSYDPFAANEGAKAMNSPSCSEMLETIDAMSSRTWEVTEDAKKKELTEAELKARADGWAREAGVGGRKLVYEKRGAGPTARPLISEPGKGSWNDWTVPRSMREVEPGVRLVMEDSRSTHEPAWRPRAAQSGEDQE